MPRHRPPGGGHHAREPGRAAAGARGGARPALLPGAGGRRGGPRRHLLLSLRGGSARRHCQALRRGASGAQQPQGTVWPTSVSGRLTLARLTDVAIVKPCSEEPLAPNNAGRPTIPRQGSHPCDFKCCLRCMFVSAHVVSACVSVSACLLLVLASASACTGAEGGSHLLAHMCLTAHMCGLAAGAADILRTS